jgi:thiosulfate/3-mercaptopyruvate sulfurtransferase
MKKYFVVIALVSFFAVAVYAGGLSGVGTSPKGLETSIEKAAMKLVTDVKDGGYKLIDTEELNKWVAEKSVFILIDTMPKENFDKIRIKGAVNSPVAKTEKEFTPAEKENILKIAGSDKSKTVVVYCGFTGCRRSHLGAKTLVENGFSSVYRHPGGIVAWNENGYPEEGTDTK